MFSEYSTGRTSTRTYRVGADNNNRSAQRHALRIARVFTVIVPAA